MDKKSSYSDIDTPRQRFFGWIPTQKAPRIFFWLNVLYFVLCWFVWPQLPQFLAFGWIPSTYIWYYLVASPIGFILWGIYFNKYWTGLKDEEE